MTQDDSGLITLPSRFPVRETIDRLAGGVTSAGMRIFARIDHAAGAAEVGMALRPTELLIFGNPRAGTLLMADRQTAGIDLPVKALAWEDADGTVWLTYNDAHWLARRHGLGSASEHPVEAIAAVTASVTRAAAG